VAASARPPSSASVPFPTVPTFGAKDPADVCIVRHTPTANPGARMVGGPGFRARAGEVTRLLGPNGPGQTTRVEIPTTHTETTQRRAPVGGFDIVRDVARNAPPLRAADVLEVRPANLGGYRHQLPDSDGFRRNRERPALLAIATAGVLRYTSR